MASVATTHGRRSRSEARPSTAPVISNTHAPTAVSTRPPHSFSRSHHPKFNIDTHTACKISTPRRGSGNLALQARDSVAVRKRNMSSGAMSARVARQSARKANASMLQPNLKTRDVSPSDLDRGRKRSRSPAATPSTRTNSHRNRASRSPSSSSSPSQTPPPVTPGLPALSGAPSSYHTRTHVPHNSQETTTSAYPPSSSQSSRSSSSSPSRSRILSPPPQPQKPPSSLQNIPTLDLDPDDVNARLRLLVNNSYFLPPAHTKPELSPIYLTPPSSKGTTSPSAFKEFFRVGKKKEKKTPEVNGCVSPSGRRGMSPADAPRMISNDADRRYGTSRNNFDLQLPTGPVRNRVVVVRETVENLPPPAIRSPYRTSSLPSHNRPRKYPETMFIDPTTQYDMPPPTHYPSYNNLRLDAAGLTGNVELDQFAPPGEPWSPTPTSPRSSRGPGGGMDPQERVWRRALLEQAVDLSLSSTASDPGHGSPGLQEDSFRGLRMSNEEVLEPTSPVSPKNKKTWWGKKDREKDVVDLPQRHSTSSSNKERDVFHTSGKERGTHSLEVPVQPHTAPLPGSKRNLGQSIIPHADLEELERQHSQRVTERNAGLPPQLRLNVSPFGPSPASAPVTPLYHHHNPPSTPPLPMTPLRPRPAYRRGDTSAYSNASGEQVAPDFFQGQSTIRKSLSSPLLSDLHEMGVEVEGSMTFANGSRDSVAAPSLVLQDPHGVTSLVPSNTTESLTSGSNYSEDDERSVFDRIMSPHEQPFGFQDDDVASLDRWHRTISPDHGDGRPSFDSFGTSRVRSPDECPARASSTFGFRRSNLSVANPSPLRGSHQDIDVDISGDPIEHLLLMESQRSVSPGAESQASSFRGYVSALDHTFHGSGAPSMRPSSPASKSFRSTDTKLASTNSQPDSSEEINTAAPISFFDSVQHQSYMDGDGVSSDSDVDADADIDAEVDVDVDADASEPPDVQPTIEHDKHEWYTQPQTLGRKSLNTIRPTPSFATQFRNASQPQLPLPRGDNGPPLASIFRPIQPYDLLDRKKPLTNTPLSAPSTSTGFLSQLKGRSGKRQRPLPGLVPISPMVLPEATFELLRYPHGSAFSLSTGAGAGGRSNAGNAEAGLRGFETQGSFQSSQSVATASLSHPGPWKQEQDESTRKLDGMVTQHLEEEKDRLRKIATAAREKRPL